MPKFAFSLIFAAVTVIVPLATSLLGGGALGLSLPLGFAALMMAGAGVTLTVGIVLLERSANWGYLDALRQDEPNAVAA